MTLRTSYPHKLSDKNLSDNELEEINPDYFSTKIVLSYSGGMVTRKIINKFRIIRDKGNVYILPNS